MYRDINPTLQAHPDTRDILVRTDIGAINNSLTNLVLLSKYERPYNKNLYGGVYRMLFEPCDTLTAGSIETAIEQLINNFEKRAQDPVVQVKVNSTQDGYDIAVAYTSSRTGKQGQLQMGISRQ